MKLSSIIGCKLDWGIRVDSENISLAVGVVGEYLKQYVSFNILTAKSEIKTRVKKFTEGKACYSFDGLPVIS